MILMLSKNVEEAHKKLSETLKLSQNTTGESRKDDEQLARIDALLGDIKELLVPATDER